MSVMSNSHARGTYTTGQEPGMVRHTTGNEVLEFKGNTLFPVLGE